MFYSFSLVLWHVPRMATPFLDHGDESDELWNICRYIIRSLGDELQSDHELCIYVSYTSYTHSSKAI